MSSFVCKLRRGGCAQADFGLAGCLLIGFPPCVQLPPFVVWKRQGMAP